MAATSVLIPFLTINQNGGVLPPSAPVQHAPRHGRSRANSSKGKGGRGRTYSVIEERDVTISKAVVFVLKRSVPEIEASEDDKEAGRLLCDPDGWVSVADVLKHPKIVDLGATLADLQQIGSTSTRTRFALRELPGVSVRDDPAAYQVRQNGRRNSLESGVMEGLPEYIVYETTYQAWPLILTSGCIKKKAGSPEQIFKPVSEARTTERATASDTAEVTIWIDLRAALKVAPEIQWHHLEKGGIATSAEEVPKALWKKVVARRSDVGVVFEDGEVRREVPEAIRKGAKSKGKKAKSEGFLQSRAEDEDSSDGSVSSEE